MAVAEAVRAAAVATNAEIVGAFERRMAELLGVSRTLATANGTAALHLILHLLGVGPGDEVIVPALTYVATINPIRYLGATPVIVDVAPVSWTLCPNATEAAITARTKAIVPVHLYGNPAEMDALSSLAEPREIAVVEDAAESLGATLAARQTGTLGTAGFLSFNGNKLITAGGGGLLIARDPELVDRAAHLAVQARDPGGDYVHTAVGFNARMPGLNAALGCAQLDRLTDFLTVKRTFDTIYREKLSDLVDFQTALEGARPSCWLTAVALRNHGPASIREGLARHGVPTRRLFTPLHRHAPFQGLERGPMRVAEELHDRVVVLPGSTRCETGEIERTVGCLRNLLTK